MVLLMLPHLFQTEYSLLKFSVVFSFTDILTAFFRYYRRQIVIEANKICSGNSIQYLDRINIGIDTHRKVFKFHQSGRYCPPTIAAEV